jgi:single-strand DNA-binding protein
MASSYNRIILMGNLTRDPQLRYLPNQTAVVDIGLAVNDRYKTASGEQREEVMFIDCTAFGKQAEIINQYCQKGRPLLVEGRLKLDTWDDKTTGQKRSKHKVTIDNFQLLGSRDQGAPGAGGNEGGGERSYDQRPPQRGPAPARQPQAAAAARPAPEQPFGDEQQFKEDDIPF